MKSLAALIFAVLFALFCAVFFLSKGCSIWLALSFYSGGGSIGVILFSVVHYRLWVPFEEPHPEQTL